MRRRRLVAAILFAALLCAGLTGRVARAALQDGPNLARDEAAVAAFFEARGWRADERVPVTANFDYAARVFRKWGCGVALVVAPVGAGVEAGGLFRGAGGLDWTFVHAGASHAAPPTARFFLDHARALLTRAPAPASVLALARAPAGAQADEPEACAPPAATDFAAYADYQEGRRTAAE
jgi:hypothetical protein